MLPRLVLDFLTKGHLRPRNPALVQRLINRAARWQNAISCEIRLKNSYNMRLVHVGARLIDPRTGLLRAVQTTLRCMEDGLLHFGPPCSSWVWLSRGSTFRSEENVLGNPDVSESARLGNEKLGKRMGWCITNNATRVPSKLDTSQFVQHAPKASLKD